MGAARVGVELVAAEMEGEAWAEVERAGAGPAGVAAVGPAAVTAVALAWSQAPEEGTMASEALAAAVMLGAAAVAGRQVVGVVAAEWTVVGPMEAEGAGATAAGAEGHEARTRAPAGA